MARSNTLFFVKHLLLIFVFAMVGSVFFTGDKALAYDPVDKARCFDTTHEVGVVIFVAIYDSNGVFQGYSNSFDFRVDNNIDSTSNASLKYRAHNSVISWNGGVKQAFGQNAYTDLPVRPGTPYGQGNMCDPTPGGGGAKVEAYAFRSGDGTVRRTPDAGESNKSIYNNSGRYPARSWECIQKDRTRTKSSGVWGSWTGWGTDCGASGWVYKSWVYNPTPSINANGWSCSTVNVTTTKQRQTCTYGLDIAPEWVGWTNGSGAVAGWENNGSLSLSCLGIASVKFTFNPLRNYDARFGSQGGSFTGSTTTRKSSGSALVFDGTPTQVIKSSDNTEDLNGQQFTVIFRFQLNPPANFTPSTSITPSSSIEVGDPYTATASFWNSSTTAGTISANWRTWMDTDQDFTNGGTGSVTNGSVANQPVAGNSTFTLSPPHTGVADGAYNWVCTELYNISSPSGGILQTGVRKTCVSISKAPGFAVRRGDVRAGGLYTVSSGSPCRTTIPTSLGIASFAPIRGHLYASTKASAAEYAAITPGQIINIKKPGGGVSDLLFGSAGWGAPFNGYYLGLPTLTTRTAVTHCLPAVGEIYAPYAKPQTTTATSASSTGEYILDNVGDETLTVCTGGCVLNAGERRVILVNTTATATGIKKVRVDGNVTYSGLTYASINDVPEFVLLAGPGVQLEFAAGVTEVNGIVAAHGKVRTCDLREGGPSGAMTKSDCTSPLLVKGMLVTDGRVYPFRTAGFSTAADNSYAEEFRSVPGLLLSDYARARAEQTVTTHYQVELPPRF